MMLLTTSLSATRGVAGYSNKSGRRFVTESRILAREEAILGRKEITWINVRIPTMTTFNPS
jgi:hypothetical protein